MSGAICRQQTVVEASKWLIRIGLGWEQPAAKGYSIIGKGESATMEPPSATENRLALLLRVVGGVCLLALVPLWMPRAWMDVGHRWFGWGPFPDHPLTEYLARSVSALSGFYGGLLIALSVDVRRYAPLIRYQAAAIMVVSASGVVVGSWAGMPLWFVGGDAVACWGYSIPTIVLVRQVEHCRDRQS